MGQKGNQFSTFAGVFTPSILTILGVIMFLRAGYVIGEAGIRNAILILLAAEMKMPGRAWLHFEVEPRGRGTELRMTAIFDPVGVWGRLYWFMVYPFHFLVFNGMFEGIVKAAHKMSGEECP